MEEFRSLLILMVTVWVAGKVFRALRLPIIFGELLGGIIVGPLILNLVDPEMPGIKMLAELGIFFLMFHAGLEADPYELIRASKKSILIAIGGVAVPFAGGMIVSAFFGQPFIPSLFISLCLSISAIATSARLFKDYRMERSNAAHVTMAAAVINDIIGLVIFSLILSLYDSGRVEVMEILLLIAKMGLFFGVVMWGGFRISKYMGKILKNKGFTFALIVALTLGLIAESIGLHMILGAFLAGLFIREEVLDEKTFDKIEDRIYGLSYSFLGPIFFATLAFHLDFSSIYHTPVFLGAVLVVAVLGKVFGVGAAAIAQKMKWSESILIAVAMNSRGAVELIIASIGFQKGVIDQSVFSILVFMGFVTTVITIFAMKPLAKAAH